MQVTPDLVQAARPDTPKSTFGVRRDHAGVELPWLGEEVCTLPLCVFRLQQIVAIIVLFQFVALYFPLLGQDYYFFWRRGEDCSW